jgi:hypothetical protein
LKKAPHLGLRITAALLAEITAAALFMVGTGAASVFLF